MRLEDCGDILHFENIDCLMNNDKGLLLCPLCTLPITNTQRYRDRIQQDFQALELRSLSDEQRDNLKRIDDERKEILKDLKQNWHERLSPHKSHDIIGNQFL